MTTTPLHEKLRNYSLILLSISLIPVSLLLVLFTSISKRLWPKPSFRNNCQNGPLFKERTILVTGIGMAKGLTLARAFHQCGHRVIGADFETSFLHSSGRVSNACVRFYRLDTPSCPQMYSKQLVEIIKKEQVDLWVSCSGVATALDDGHAQEAIKKLTNCCCIQFDAATTDLLHDKSTFLRYTDKLGLPVPRTCHLVSKAAACDALADLDEGMQKPEMFAQQRFILKPVGVDDVNRGNMTLLPLSTRAETKTYVKRLPITSDNPWILQQYIPGGEEYCTHALVVSGEVKVFVACPSAELLMHYKALPSSDPLSCYMLDFTRKFAAHCNEEYGSFTGHLSFDFMAETCSTGEGVEKKLYAIECNPRVHTAVVLFSQEGHEMHQMVEAYLAEVVDRAPDGTWTEEDSIPDTIASEKASRASGRGHVVTPPRDTIPRYWIGHDLIMFVVVPLLHLLSLSISVYEFSNSIGTFLEHVCGWKEGTFSVWDPWPFVKLYHDYWPRAIALALWEDRRWSRLNVSTTKMFAS